mmetsp:Transcript_9711/g.15596  ORF Transcript_9711/g.15596 Transcript_9711/m.15596 type:complete len:202 (+) Transcript_9711:569-1174(+)
MCRCFPVFFRERHDGLILEQYRPAFLPCWVVLRPEGAVGGDLNPMLLAVGNKFRLSDIRVGLNLVDRRSDLGHLHNVINLFYVEVGDSNGSHQAAFNKFLHCCPCFRVVNFIELIVSVDKRETHWPMNQIEIQVSEAQVLQSLLAGRKDFLFCVIQVPHLAGNKQLLSFYPFILHAVLQGIAHLNLVPIDGSAVDVTISTL